DDRRICRHPDQRHAALGAGYHAGGDPYDLGAGRAVGAVAGHRRATAVWRMNRLQTSGTVAALAWLVLSFLALPVFAVIPVSFTDTRYLSLRQEHLSLQHWRPFLSSREWLSSIWESFWIASVSTAMA